MKREGDAPPRQLFLGDVVGVSLHCAREVAARCHPTDPHQANKQSRSKPKTMRTCDVREDQLA